MKPVNLNGLSGGINSVDSAKAQRHETPAKVNHPVSGADRSDQVTVSGRADEVARLVARAQELGDIRHERVQHVQQLMDSGRYAVSSEQIADAIIRDEN